MLTYKKLHTRFRFVGLPKFTTLDDFLTAIIYSTSRQGVFRRPTRKQGRPSPNSDDATFPLPFPSSPLFPFPFPSFPFPFLRNRIPLIQLGGLRERCELPSAEALKIWTLEHFGTSEITSASF